MHLTRAPYFIDYGEYRDFRYFQSDYGIVRELSEHCPQIFANKWVLCTAFDGTDFMAPGEEENDDYKVLNEKPFKLKSILDLPSSGNGDEFYFFDEEVAVESLNALNEIQPFDEVRLSDTNVSGFDKNWEQLNEVKATAYLFSGNYSTFIFKDKSSVQSFIESAYYKRIPTIHIEQEISRRKYLRDRPTTNEKCIKDDCQRKRILYGVNCAKHHYQMLNGDMFLEEIFDDPLPGEERRSISLQNLTNSDKLILGFTALLVISFIVLIVCFVVATTK